MSDWGLNPGSVGAFGTAGAAIFGLAVSIISIRLAAGSLRESRLLRESSDREQSDRMRPWLGLFELRVNVDDQPPALLYVLRNVGTLPAQGVEVRILLKPIATPDVAPVTWSDDGEKTLMPGEDGNYGFALSGFPPLAQWFESREDIGVVGTVNYGLGDRRFATEFDARLYFSRPQDAHDGVAPMNWKNVRAV